MNIGVRDITQIAKALAEEHRLRVLAALKGRELCVCQITEFLGLAPSTVSAHMAVLQRAGLVERWQEGRWVNYRLAGEGAPPLVREALAWVGRWLDESEQAGRDAARLAQVLCLEREDLCRRQNL